MVNVEDVFSMTDRPAWVVTARSANGRGGLLATFVMLASIDPKRPVVMVGIGANHYTAELIMASGAFGLHLLADDQLELAWRMAIGSGRDFDKLAGLTLTVGASTAPLIEGCPARLDCRVLASFDMGDRIYFWGDVLSSESNRQGAPLTEKSLLAAAGQEQLAELRRSRDADIAIQSPALEQWLARHKKE